MDVGRFQPDFPGELLDLGRGEVAFVPAPLPPTWDFDATLWPLLVDAKHQLGILDGLTRRIDDVGILLRPLQQREALRSSSLEGTYATPRELLLFDLDPQEPRSTSDAASAWQEVHNYWRALQLGDAAIGDSGISLVLVRQLHSELLAGVRGRDKSPGRFRTDQVYVGSDHRFVPPPVTHLQGCLDALQAYLRVVDDQYDPLVRCFLVHYQFEAIHPFFDGNGRVGRLLLALTIKEWCELRRPWLYLSAFFDRHKDEYIDRLFAVSTHGDWAGWIRLCLRATIEQARDTIHRCDELIALRAEYRGRVQESRANVRVLKIVDELFVNPLVRTADLRNRIGVTYPTAQADIVRLVKLGILEELSGVRPRTYVARKIFTIAFSEPDRGEPDVES